MNQIGFGPHKAVALSSTKVFVLCRRMGPTDPNFGFTDLWLDRESLCRLCVDDYLDLDDYLKPITTLNLCVFGWLFITSILKLILVLKLLVI